MVLLNRINNDTVLFSLNGHIGKHNGIHADYLTMKVAGVMPLPGHVRVLRKVITDLRLEGHAICGTPDRGYFIANNETELLETCNFLYDRAMSSITIIARMRGVSLPDLKGQLRLPT